MSLTLAAHHHLAGGDAGLPPQGSSLCTAILWPPGTHCLEMKEGKCISQGPAHGTSASAA